MNFQTMSKQRKFVLMAAAVGIISMFLPWVRISVFGFSQTVNGLHGVGVLVFLCFVVVGIIAYFGDQTKNLDKTMWMITLVCGTLATLIIIWNIIDASGSIMGSFLSFGIYLAGLAALGVLLSAFLLRSPTDTIKDGFESLKKDINNKIKTTPTTLDTMNPPTTNPNDDANKNISGYAKKPENIDNSGNANLPL